MHWNMMIPSSTASRLVINTTNAATRRSDSSYNKSTTNRSNGVFELIDSVFGDGDYSRQCGQGFYYGDAIASFKAGRYLG